MKQMHLFPEPEPAPKPKEPRPCQHERGIIDSRGNARCAACDAPLRPAGPDDDTDRKWHGDVMRALNAPYTGPA